MKLLTFSQGGRDRLGVLVQGKGVLDVASASAEGRLGFAADMQSLIEAGPSSLRELAAIVERATLGTAEWIDLSAVALRAPIPRPRKNVFCVGMNYRKHIDEMAHARGRDVVYPKVAAFFTKTPTTVIGHGEDIERHARNTSALDYEVELALVIGRRCRDLTRDAALSAVFGYTIVNDVTARDAQQAHTQFFKGKSFDRTCPMGPWIVTADEFGDPSGHGLRLRVNGEVRQDSTTADLLFDVPEILVALSASLTLEPGDVVATGTPAGVAQGMTPPRFLQDGDVVEAEIDGIGLLRNAVAEM